MNGEADMMWIHVRGQEVSRIIRSCEGALRGACIDLQIHLGLSREASHDIVCDLL